MLKRLGYIFLCLTFVFATSGNSAGLIFKNMAKTSHELKMKADAQSPAAEEIFEQVTEKRPPAILTFYFNDVNVLKTVNHSNIFINDFIPSYIHDIPVPPPKF